MKLYSEKRSIYFTQIREDLISKLPDTTLNKILEVGAGGCDTLVAIKEREKANVVVGIELFAIPNSNQNNPLVDKLFICDIEKEFPALNNDEFDAIICGDVLEHLVDPWSVVAKLTKVLKPGGTIIVSCPNIREIFTLSKILFTGNFNYQESGILDKTHLRFFCLKNLKELLTLENLDPILAEPNYFITPRRKAMSFLHLNILDEFLAAQLIVVSKKR
jgi:2-polyprenyl-3-methyl-5-hydroxy-6-metoxy-1,4-benzoquinol methylase